jgi:hypothetical protein
MKSLCVAVTGHRLNQLPEPERPRIAQELARCLEEIEGAAQRAFGRVRMTMASAVAEGADRYAAEAALARGWRLHTPLPFSIERYEEDFEDEASVNAFQRYLKLSEKVWSMSPEDVAACGEGSAAPYAAVGRALVAQADLLIAIWNGLPPKGPGGTAEVAALMLERGGCVLWIPVEAGVGVRLVAPRRAPRKASLKHTLLLGLKECFEEIRQPPEMRVA